LSFKFALQQLDVDRLIVDDEDFGLTVSAQRDVCFWGRMKVDSLFSNNIQKSSRLLLWKLKQKN